MQISLDIPANLSKDAYDYGSRSDGGTHGVVLTKAHMVELVLDLVGYKRDTDLTTTRLLEPSCGQGAFLIPALERLLASAKANRVNPSDLRNCIAAFDIDQGHVDVTQEAVISALIRHDVPEDIARTLAKQWVQQADFLLAPLQGGFDFVVGNPPYIRIEQLSQELQDEYRRRYSTLFDRADLYVAFIERGLRLLAPHGVLSFVCADRWTLNKYGAPLRKLISTVFALRTYVDLHKASPFESDVIAYPSIFVIARQPRQKPVSVITLSHATPDECDAVRAQLVGQAITHEGVLVQSYAKWFEADEPWVLSSPEQLATLRDMEARLPLLEETGGTSVRIGIATGNDSVYIVPADADIEPDRLVPLVMRGDIERGTVRDARRCVINTYEAKGTIDVSNYPRLKRYLDEHEAALRERHVAQKSTAGWFRTIDRPYPELVHSPKLLIPDIAGSNEVVYESGKFYPHHNLYFVTSDEWDMEVLGGLLSSRVALFFVWSYAVKMRGGYLRFQAQYLRRIRVPQPDSIPQALQRKIKAAYRKRNFSALDELARLAYQLPTIPTFDFVDTRK